MPIQNHPAVKANILSTELASIGDKTAWLALYAEDAILKDPVGMSMLEPSGEGHRGKAAIESFWDTVIGPSNIKLEVKQRIISGSHDCAVFQQVSNDMGNGKITVVDMIATYKVNDQGLIVEMHAYWNFDNLMAQML
jgi:ketosteroid isomerase-like protein